VYEELVPVKEDAVGESRKDALFRWVVGAVYTGADILADVIHGLCYAFVTGVYEALEGYIYYEGENEGSWTYSCIGRKKRHDNNRFGDSFSDNQISEYIDKIIQDFRKEQRDNK